MTSQKLFNFNNILKSETEYNHIKDEVKDSILESYRSRKFPVKILIGTEAIDSTLGNVLVNLLLCTAFVESGIEITKDDIYLESTVTQDSIEKYINHTLNRFRENGEHDYQIIRNKIYQSLNEMSDISGNLNALSGNSISYRDFVRLAVNDPEAKALFKPEIKPGAFNEIESQFNDCGNKLFNYFKTHTNTELYPFIASETGVNKKQLTQCLSVVGLKPDMDGSVIPVVIRDNFLNGLSGLESYFINCKRYKKGTYNK